MTRELAASNSRWPQVSQTNPARLPMTVLSPFSTQSTVRDSLGQRVPRSQTGHERRWTPLNGVLTSRPSSSFLIWSSRSALMEGIVGGLVRGDRVEVRCFRGVLIGFLVVMSCHVRLHRVLHVCSHPHAHRFRLRKAVATKTYLWAGVSCTSKMTVTIVPSLLRVYFATYRSSMSSW